MVKMCCTKSSLQGIIMLILCSSINRSGAAKPFTSRVLPSKAKPEQSCGIPQSTATGRLEKSQLVPLAKSGVDLIYRDGSLFQDDFNVF